MIQKGKGKAKKVSFVLQSPGRRKSSTIAGAKREFFPVISMSFKNSGIRRIVNQYNQMESEVSTLKKRYVESRQMGRGLKETVRVQRDKSRQLIIACTYKLQEKEAVIEKINAEHDQALAAIARELTYLQANMIKEQKKLEAIISEQTKALEAASTENERLRKQNKKLQSNTSKLLPMLDDRDMDTPSSEESSPKSSFSSKASTKIEIKPRSQSPLASSAKKTSAPRPSPTMEKRPPPPPPPSSSSPPKPPIPSRAGVNKKLLRSTSSSAPPPPARSTSLNVSVDRADSGRESDLTSDAEHHTALTVLPLPSSDERLEGGHHHQDEGFCSSHEDNSQQGRTSSKSYDSFIDQAGLHQKSIVSPSRLLTNHRGVQKPSDIKYRSKIKSTSSSNLAVLDEHQIIEGGAQVTTVTYWTEPYL